MIIEEVDFKLEPCNESMTFFDLELPYVVNKGKTNERTEFRNVAYGISLESAIRRIAMYRLNNKHEDESISLKVFLKEFKEEINKIKQICEI